MLGESDWNTLRRRLSVLPAFALTWRVFRGGTWLIDGGDTTARIRPGHAVPRDNSFWNRRQVEALAANPDYRPTPLREETLRDLERRHGVPPDVVWRFIFHGRLPEDDTLIADALDAYLPRLGA